jgi:hypothetical protein
LELGQVVEQVWSLLRAWAPREQGHLSSVLDSVQVAYPAGVGLLDTNDVPIRPTEEQEPESMTKKQVEVGVKLVD